MENQIELYQNLVEQVKTLNESFINEIEKNPNGELKKVYKGCQILFSPLIFKPKFMFMGINPGAGFYNHKDNNKNCVLKYEPEKTHEYIEHSYRLQKQTVKMFEKAGLKNFLKDSVKSNFYYFATSKESELKQFITSDIYQKSKKWTSDLIQIIQPEIIICEGKNSFEKIKSLLNAKVDNNVNIKNDGVNFAQTENIKIIGYHRLFSNIKNLDKVSDFLKTKYH